MWWNEETIRPLSALSHLSSLSPSPQHWLLQPHPPLPQQGLAFPQLPLPTTSAPGQPPSAGWLRLHGLLAGLSARPGWELQGLVWYTGGAQ
jgi:hypothetical protein